jgi:hypothetical protein
MGIDSSALDKLIEQPDIPPSKLAGMQNGFQTQIDSRSDRDIIFNTPDTF